jgi:nucleoside-diphosphate-sugar epimerase
MMTLPDYEQMASTTRHCPVFAKMVFRPMPRLTIPENLAETLRRDSAPIIITGAGGWLGQAALDMLVSALGDALPARLKIFATTPRTITLRSGHTLQAKPFAALESETSAPSLILHFAFLTQGFAHTPDFIATNQKISATMRGFIARNGARGLFIPSSGAAYKPENPYGALKREDEENFSTLAAAQNFPAAIIRIFNLAGPFINNLPNYALASIILDILANRPITLRAAHPVFRSYAHVQDVLNIALAIILNRLDVGIFDTAGDPPLEIGDLATRISTILTGKILPIHRPASANSPPDRYLGDLAAYAYAAARAGIQPKTLDQQIIDTARFIESLPAKPLTPDT